MATSIYTEVEAVTQIRVRFLSTDPDDPNFVIFDYEGKTYRFRRVKVPGCHVTCSEHALGEINGIQVEFWWFARDIWNRSNYKGNFRE